MSYHRNRNSPPALGNLASTVTSVVNAVGTASDVANDPYFPELVCRVGQLRELNAGRAPGACATTKGGLPGGVGLRKVMPAVRGYVYAQQHKWVAPVAIAAVLGVPLLIGYAIGRGK